MLGVGAKTVDDEPNDKTISAINESENIIDETYHSNFNSTEFEGIEDTSIKNQNDLYSAYFDSASNRNQSKRDMKVKNFLIAFVVVVVILAIYFFTR